MLKRVGFTGTQAGMTRQQRIELDGYLRGLRVVHTLSEFHHGDCIGADSNFHSYLVARLLKWQAYDLIFIHPPEDESKRAWCYSKNIFAPRPYLERNRDIVDAVDILIATPRQQYEVVRSGTWATIRYARKMGRKVRIIWP